MPASCVTVQIGQCGTQLGACVLDRLNARRRNGDAQYFFRQGKSGERVARAVLVDTEPRVVGEVEGGDRDWNRWVWRANRGIVDAGLRGCANNWAKGFSSEKEGVNRAADVVRRDGAERSRRPFIIVRGGRGEVRGVVWGVPSTAASLMTTQKYGPCTVSSPDRQGDVAVGSYNATLTLNHLSKDAKARRRVVFIVQ